jgi:hypothetical protein
MEQSMTEALTIVSGAILTVLTALASSKNVSNLKAE